MDIMIHIPMWLIYTVVGIIGMWIFCKIALLIPVKSYEFGKSFCGEVKEFVFDSYVIDTYRFEWEGRGLGDFRCQEYTYRRKLNERPLFVKGGKVVWMAKKNLVGEIISIKPEKIE